MDPAATVKRIIETATLRRRVFVWMQFEPDATGDAIVIVALTAVVLGLGLMDGFSLSVAASLALSALFAWLIISGLTWAAAKFIFDSSNDYAPVLRVAGYAFPTLLALLVTARIFPNVFGVILGFVWFLVAVAAGVQEVMDLKQEHALGAAAAGFGGWMLLQLIFRGFGTTL